MMPNHEFNNRKKYSSPRIHPSQINGKGHMQVTTKAPPAPPAIAASVTPVCQTNESPFDNVLKVNDFTRAERLVSIPNFLHLYPPQTTLDQFMRGKEGDEGFSPTLCLLIESGVYNVTANFLMHILVHFSSENILTVLKSMKYDYQGTPKKVMHFALRRATKSTIPSEVSLEIIEKLLNLGFDLNSLDDMNQSAIFYFIQGKYSVIHFLFFFFFLCKSKYIHYITRQMSFTNVFFMPKLTITIDQVKMNHLAIHQMTL